MTRGRRTLLAILAIVLAALIWLLLPPRWTPPSAAAHPARSRGEALERMRRLQALDDSAALFAPCSTMVLDHGANTARVYVLLHGFTNCPRQFGDLAKLLYDDGANVLVPRMPRHGIADAPHDVLASLTADELVGLSSEAVDIAHGLGDHVSIVALSSSAVVAGWLAEQRNDLDQVMLIAPSLAPRSVPLWLAVPLANALVHLPHIFVPWDAKRRQPLGPRTAFPGFSTRALARVYELGFHVLHDGAPPRSTRVILVTTLHDEGVNNGVVAELGKRWAKQGCPVRSFEFPAEAWVHHDMIDPEQPYQRVSVVYPVLRKLLETGSATLADSAAYAEPNAATAQAGTAPP